MTSAWTFLVRVFKRTGAERPFALIAYTSKVKIVFGAKPSTLKRGLDVTD